MIKELLINGEVNRFTLTNRARQAIAFQYITDTKTLRLIDTYNNVSVNLVAEGDNALTSSAMEQVWQYIQNKVDDKVGGSFKFRGQVQSLDEVVNPKPGDIYQVRVETCMYDPHTGQKIPSSVQYNDKEYAWAEPVDPNTGLPTGGKWVELGFNFADDGSAGGVTEQWVKDYFVGQYQQQEVLSGIIAHTQLSTQLETREEAVGEHAVINHTIETTKQDLTDYIDAASASLIASMDEISAYIINYIDNTVSTNIIYYVNGKVGELSGHIDSLREYVDAQGNELDEKLSGLSGYVNEQDEAIRTSINDLHEEMITRMDVTSGGFVTRDEYTVALEDMRQQHVTDLSFVLYDDQGNIVNG